MRRLTCARIAAVILLVLISAQTVAASDKDFKMIVKKIESSYNARQRKIPFLGLAGFLVKIVKPAGVKEFKLAIFEEQDFSPGTDDHNFHKTIESSFKDKWQPVVRSNMRSEGSRAFVYSQPAGKDIELLSVTFSRRQAIVVQAKVDPQAVMKFLENPQIMGISLADSFKGDSIFAGNSGGVFGGTTSSSGGSSNSIRSLDGTSADQLDARASREKPALRVRSKTEGDPDLEPALSGAADSTGPRPAEKDVIKLEARLVNLNVKVTDGTGNPVGNLNKEDFVILEDGVQQEIAYFEPVSAPVNLVLLLDLSGSTKDKRQTMISAAKKFIDQLGKDDRVALAAFTREFKLLSDFTTDRKLLKKRVEEIKKIGGGTAYYDAMWTTLDLLSGVGNARKAIVVLTDGVDNSIVRSGYAPTEHTFEELLGRVMEDEATIYPIYFDTDEWKTRFDRIRDRLAFDPTLADRYEERMRPNRIAREQLETLAQQTAGIVIDADGEANLDAAYERVARELRTLYSLGYSPKDLKNNGLFRKIGVQVNREGVTAKARRGYYAR
ncbi:MAG TPA: VWA domain-containing protein [Blastocatellia bacterium]|nr:VWA domain-containing protein [Blastocatellia bacterium]